MFLCPYFRDSLGREKKTKKIRWVVLLPDRSREREIVGNQDRDLQL